MDGRKWFILSNDLVKGPYEKDEIERHLHEHSDPLIWGRGQTEWLRPPQWEKLLVDLENTLTRNRRQSEREWRVRLGEQELRPMLYNEMIEYLRPQTDLGQILIWTEGYSEWKEVYQVHKIMDDLGVSRRQHPRVPIMGQVEMEGASGSFSARALSISEGGMGVTDAPQVRIGDKFKIGLKSPNLFAPLHATAEVVFAGHDGYIGLKFSGLPTESKSSIIEYVKKFSDQPTGLTSL